MQFNIRPTTLYICIYQYAKSLLQLYKHQYLRSYILIKKDKKAIANQHFHLQIAMQLSILLPINTLQFNLLLI